MIGEMVIKVVHNMFIAGIWGRSLGVGVGVLSLLVAVRHAASASC